MKKITNREKVLIGFGAVAAIGILVYFVILPMFVGDRAKARSDFKIKEEKLQALEKLKTMEPLITDLEGNMKTQLGYSQMSFKRSSAEPTIMKYLAQIANQSEIKEIEQLDVKPQKGKKKQVEQKSDQNTLKSVVDRLYMYQVAKEKDNPEQPIAMGGSSTPEKKIVKISDNSEKDEVEAKNKKTGKKSAEADPEESFSEESLGSNGLLFPVMPKDAPIEVKRAFAGFVQTNNGQTPTSEELDTIMESSGIKDDQQKEQIKKRFILYDNRVKDKKGDAFGLINKMDIAKNTKLDDRAGRFTAKMVFKSDITQLIKLLYNLQTSAKWVKVDSIQINIADRQKGTLAVEIGMIATALYDEETDEKERM
jgi:hypothetical protein